MTSSPFIPPELSGHDFRARFQRAQSIVDEYARVLDNITLLPGQVADAALLPREKEDIRSALYLCLSCNLDPQLSEHLEAGYLLLSAFQPELGHDIVGEQFVHYDLDADPAEIAARLEREHAQAVPWRQLAQAELARLQQDIDQLRAMAISYPM